MARHIERVGESVILYDDSLLSHRSEALFDPASWPAAPAAPGYAGGRGNTLLIVHEEQQWVLRHYHRGGLIGRILNDEFLWWGQQRTRCFREWLLLESLTESGLPVPRPVAARFVRRRFTYTADLITVRLPGVQSFSRRLANAPVSARVWRSIGAMLARFHDALVFHADLTAHNIQIDGDDRPFLLDFDRGRIMPAHGRWIMANLRRLRRSLDKIARTDGIEFAAQQWNWLLEGYRGQHRGQCR